MVLITNIDQIALEHTGYKIYRIHINMEKTEKYKLNKTKKQFLEVVLSQFIYSKEEHGLIGIDAAVKQGVGMYKPIHKEKEMQVKGAKQTKEVKSTLLDIPGYFIINVSIIWLWVVR